MTFQYSKPKELSGHSLEMVAMNRSQSQLMALYSHETETLAESYPLGSEDSTQMSTMRYGGFMDDGHSGTPTHIWTASKYE
jgi:hypothetical protein